MALSAPCGAHVRNKSVEDRWGGWALDGAWLNSRPVRQGGIYRPGYSPRWQDDAQQDSLHALVQKRKVSP